MTDDDWFKCSDKSLEKRKKGKNQFIKLLVKLKIIKDQQTNKVHFLKHFSWQLNYILWWTSSNGFWKSRQKNQYTRNIPISSLQRRSLKCEIGLWAHGHPLGKIPKSIQKRTLDSLWVRIQLSPFLQLRPRSIVHQIGGPLQILLPPAGILQEFILWAVL